MNEKTRRVRVRQWWNAEGDHAPYRNILHDPDDDDVVIGAHQFLNDLLDGAVDGQVVEVRLVPTMEVDSGHHWRLVRPHNYERVDGPSPGVADA